MIRAPRIALFLSGSLLMMSFATCNEIYKHMLPEKSPDLPPVHASAPIVETAAKV